MIAPIAAAIGGIVALLKDCTVRVERHSDPGAAQGADANRAATPE
jgi:hypothetical protein